MIDRILDLIFPPVCGICGKIDSNWICDECEKNLQNLEICQVDEYNNENIYYKKHFYIFKYDGIIRNKIIDYKFNDKSYLYRTFEKIILNNKKVCEFIESYDIIIPVPVHRKRKMERGYNQSELIIRELIKEIQTKEKIITLNNKSLVKIKNTNKQSLLNKEERRKNIKDSYILVDNIYAKNLQDKKVLIFDDIYTTGSTVNECAKIIKLANPDKIDVLTFAKD